MKKKYIVEFVQLDGAVYDFEFITEDLEKTITEYVMNRPILSHTLKEVRSPGTKQMLLG